MPSRFLVCFMKKAFQSLMMADRPSAEEGRHRKRFTVREGTALQLVELILSKLRWITET